MTRVTDEQLDKALDILHDRDGIAAQSRANRLHLEEYRKSLKALIMNEYQLESLGAQERHAYSAPRYIDFLEKVLHTAIEEDEKHKYLREGAAATIEIWRSQQANERKGQIV